MSDRPELRTAVLVTPTNGTSFVSLDPIETLTVAYTSPGYTLREVRGYSAAGGFRIVKDPQRAQSTEGGFGLVRVGPDVGKVTVELTVNAGDIPELIAALNAAREHTSRMRVECPLRSQDPETRRYVWARVGTALLDAIDDATA